MPGPRRDQRRGVRGGPPGKGNNSGLNEGNIRKREIERTKGKKKGKRGLGAPSFSSCPMGKRAFCRSHWGWKETILEKKRLEKCLD